MDSDNVCYKCQCQFPEIDPHVICKSCRQPNPQKFYCNDNLCSACIDIKSFKHLENILRNHELKKINKCISSKYIAHLKRNSNIDSNNFQENTKKNVNDISSESSTKQLEERLLEKLVMKISDPKFFEQRSSLEKKCLSPPCSSSSMSSTSKVLLSEVQTILDSFTNIEPSNFVEAESNYNFLLTSLFKSLNTGLFINPDNSDPVIKLSSKASDIILSSTLLSTPSSANKLIKAESYNNDVWPKDLKISNILNLHSETIRIKAHPKVRHLQNFLFGKIEPSLPKNVMAPNFSLPPVPHQLQSELIFARSHLNRILLLYSILDNFIGFKEDLQTINRAFLTLVLGQVELVLINQANFIGLLIQEIRKVLLDAAICKVPGAIVKLIMGPIHPSQFFGPYVIDLQKIIVENGPTYCISHKQIIISLPKVPVQIFKKSVPPNKCLAELNKYFLMAKTNDTDKLIILKSLIPQSLLSDLLKFTTSEYNYEELSELFRRYGGNNFDFFSLRCSFCRRFQLEEESVEDFANTLVNLAPHCNFGRSEKEMLRNQFIFGLYDEQLRERLSKNPLWSFQESLDWVVSQVKLKNSICEDVTTTTTKKRSLSVDHKPMKRFKDSSYYDSLSRLSTFKNKYIDISNINDFKEIFSQEDSFSYQIICPWTGMLLRE